MNSSNHLSPAFCLSSMLLIMGLLLAVPAGSCAADEGVQAADFMDHGIPAPVSRHRGVAVTETPGARPLILAWLSSPSDASLLVVDANTGESEQFHHPDRVRGRSFLLTDSGQFYTYGDSKLLVYDVNDHQMDIIEGRGRFGYSITEGDDGTVYIALHPDAHLLAYDPQTRELRDLGVMADPDDQFYYPRSLEVDETGWVYAGYRRNIITAFNPETGEGRVVADQQEQGSGGGQVFRGVDGAVYGRACARGLAHVGGHEPWQRFHGGQAETLDGEPDVEPKPSIKGGHSTVYPHFPDGRYLRDINVASLEPYAEIADSEDAEEVTRITFDYESAGATIFSLTATPDGYIYGSTGHPRYLFKFDPNAETFDAIQLPGGHLNALTWQAGYIFGGLYASGELHRYDPSEPWDAEGNNPRSLARGRNPQAMITRPYLIEAHPDGEHVIMGGYYDRENVSGGGLIIHNAVTEEITMLSKHDLLVGHNPRAAAVLADGSVAFGTTVDMRRRARERASEAELFILDMQTHEVTYRTVPVPETRGVRDLRAGPDRTRLFGITDDSVLFVFEAGEQRLLHREDLSDVYGSTTGSQAPRIMKLGPDNMLYVLFEQRIVQIDPQSFEHREIGSSPVPITTGIVIEGGRIYFTHGDSLWSARLEGLQ